VSITSVQSRDIQRRYKVGATASSRFINVINLNLPQRDMPMPTLSVLIRREYQDYGRDAYTTNPLELRYAALHYLILGDEMR